MPNDKMPKAQGLKMGRLGKELPRKKPLKEWGPFWRT
jgi:hypothetical protein